MSFVGGPLSAKTLSNLRQNGKVWVRPPRIRPPWLILTTDHWSSSGPCLDPRGGRRTRVIIFLCNLSKGEAQFPSYTNSIKCEGPGCVNPSPPGHTNLLLSFSLRDKTQLRHRHGKKHVNARHANKPSLNRLTRVKLRQRGGMENGGLTKQTLF